MTDSVASAARVNRSGWRLALYGAVMMALQPLLLIKLLWRARSEPLYGQRVWQRLGYDYRPASDQVRGRVWLHAVSLGETRAAAVLMQALREHDSGIRFLLTHGTATGWAAGAALLREGDLQAWAPWDAPGCVRRFLKHFSPRCGLVMETEVWPAMLAGAEMAGVPMALVNARMSQRSMLKAERLIGLLGPAMASFSTVLAQSQADAQRLQRLGARQCVVVGNLKFDMHPDPALVAQGTLWRANVNLPVVLLASSREGEEMAWVQAWLKWREQHPSSSPVQWLIVPRHPNRFDEVIGLLTQAGLTVSRRSTWTSDGPNVEAQTADVWLGDSMGEMPLYYAMSTLALLGGSFGPFGGQNLIEAVACSCPVIVGPHTFNFDEAVNQLASKDALFRVSDFSEAIGQVQGALITDDGLNEMRARGLAVLCTHAGSAQRTVSGLAALLPPL